MKAAWPQNPAKAQVKKVPNAAVALGKRRRELMLLHRVLIAAAFTDFVPKTAGPQAAQIQSILNSPAGRPHLGRSGLTALGGKLAGAAVPWPLRHRNSLIQALDLPRSEMAHQKAKQQRNKLIAALAMSAPLTTTSSPTHSCPSLVGIQLLHSM